MDLKSYVRDVPDFPKPGIMFKDITPLLRAPEALDESVERLAEPFLKDWMRSELGPEAYYADR